jgi:hypothetical protein
VYLACSIVDTYRLNSLRMRSLISDDFSEISDWTEPASVIPYIPEMIDAIDGSSGSEVKIV